MKFGGDDLVRKKLTGISERREGKGHSGGQRWKNEALYFFAFNGEMNAYV